jgi:hypothetical protein
MISLAILPTIVEESVCTAQSNQNKASSTKMIKTNSKKWTSELTREKRTSKLTHIKRKNESTKLIQTKQKKKKQKKKKKKKKGYQSIVSIQYPIDNYNIIYLYKQLFHHQAPRP